MCMCISIFKSQSHIRNHNKFKLQPAHWMHQKTFLFIYSFIFTGGWTESITGSLCLDSIDSISVSISFFYYKPTSVLLAHTSPEITASREYSWKIMFRQSFHSRKGKHRTDLHLNLVFNKLNDWKYVLEESFCIGTSFSYETEIFQQLFDGFVRRFV